MPPKKPSKIAVLLDPSEAERFEAYCSARGFKKGTLIARLLRDSLDKEGFQQDRAAAGAPGTGARR